MILEYNNIKIEYEIKKSKIKNLYIKIKDGKVLISAPNRTSNKQIEEIVKKKADWIYKSINIQKQKNQEEVITQERLDCLQEKVETYINKYKDLIETPNKVRIRNIKTAWGSCSSNKNITISMKLANKTDKQIEYVVLHEMSHLKEMNHSEKFWNIVKTYMPEYKEIRKSLK